MEWRVGRYRQRADHHEQHKQCDARPERIGSKAAPAWIARSRSDTSTSAMLMLKRKILPLMLCTPIGS
jgi:hypothetical protein